MNEGKIERSDGRGRGRQQLLANSIEVSFHMKKKVTQYRKSGSMFSSSEPVAACSNCRRLGNALRLCSPVRPAQAEQESGPKSLAVDFAL